MAILDDRSTNLRKYLALKIHLDEIFYLWFLLKSTCLVAWFLSQIILKYKSGFTEKLEFKTHLILPYMWKQFLVKLQ